MHHYSTLTAKLNDMVHKNFDWTNKDTWQHHDDYEDIFNKFKIALQESCALHYPDYELEWILRTDASQLGVAAVLLMRRKKDDGSFVLLPIAFASHKFSNAAINWTTIEQECFGIYFGLAGFKLIGISMSGVELNDDQKKQIKKKWLVKSGRPLESFFIKRHCARA
jgi:hypothetical protein